jgi:uncharacterized protein (UPF0276 family)
MNEFKVGVGLRHIHFPHFEENLPINIDFFEIISENFINTRGRPFEVLMKIREKFPICMHGVSLSIASESSLNLEYLNKIKELAEIVEPKIISDHLCFTGLAHSNLHNLLPFAYTQENLIRIAEKISQVQDFLKRRFIFENLSAYFSLKNSEMNEAEFLNSLCEKTGCGILFDVNNLYVNSINQKFSVDDFINKVNFSHVSQLHLAGFTDFGDYIFDTHAEAIHSPVWELYKKIISLKSNLPVLIEWDENIPEYHILETEALKAKHIANEIRGTHERI